MPLITHSPSTARTDAIDRAIRAETDELIRQGYTQDAAVIQAARNVAHKLHLAEIYRQEREEVERDGKEPLW